MERPAFARCARYGTALSAPKRGAVRPKRNPGSPYLLDAVVPIRKSLQILHVCASGAAHFPRRDFVRRLIAYVLLDADRPLDPAAVIAALRQRHPNKPVEPMTGAAPPTGRAIEAATMMLRCAGVEIVVMAMAMPLPEAEWKLPVLRVFPQWPDGGAVFSAHKAHLVVTTIADPSDRLASARSIAAVVGALVAVVPGCGAVLWDAVV